MSKDYNNPAFKKLLEKLQEESWQLELLISGFAIFGLFTAYEPINIYLKESIATGQDYKRAVFTVTKISCIILTFSLLVHVLLRGLWIGALGLRYVSGDIDYEELNYGQKFTKYLKKRVGSFDKYIATLENYCSIIFAASFLLIFYVLAMTFIIITIGFTGNSIISSDWLPEWLALGFGIPFMIFIVIGMFLTFIDFVTQGFLKKKKWLAKIYFPFYWVFSFITLSFLYRPIVYNFLDNKFGRRFSLLLFPLFIGIAISFSLHYNFSNYFSPENNSNEYISNRENYEDLLDEKLGFIDHITIQSKVVKENYIKVFVPYSETIENRIFYFNEGLKPEKDIRGLDTDVININVSDRKINRDSLRREYLTTFNKIYYTKIDSVVVKSDFIVSHTKKGTLGFETFLSTKNLSDGKHTLEFKRKGLNKEKDTLYYSIAKIPFWYYPD
ncbi:hypothetical protein DFQ05_2052 [Winogradskyella wandonensis]|uniref:Uncharacterized protein n=1 Tax=Winogradskyella wandonensis TaxID=1442586 RepID=A0A4R1KNZ9_9FLAO|nr:hypothetical protein [Winogradskyella wandonensis]TCK66778.1 hypothetical protein DFQ05_2052 [Winogradskyella wandonensis]